MKNSKLKEMERRAEEMKQIAFAYRDGKLTALEAMQQRRALYNRGKGNVGKRGATAEV